MNLFLNFIGKTSILAFLNFLGLKAVQASAGNVAEGNSYDEVEDKEVGFHTKMVLSGDISEQVALNTGLEYYHYRFDEGLARNTASIETISSHFVLFDEGDFGFAHGAVREARNPSCVHVSAERAGPDREQIRRATTGFLPMGSPGLILKFSLYQLPSRYFET